MTSAQRISAGPIGLRAFGLVPAERALKPGRRRQIASPVGLRHWLRLQTNRRLVTLGPTVGGGADGIAHTELTRPVQLVGTGVDQLPVLFWFGVLRVNHFAPVVLAGLRASPAAGSFHGCFLVSTGFSSRGNTR